MQVAETDIEIKIENDQLIMVVPLNASTGELIRYLRNKAEFTQQQTADVLSVSKSTVSKVETDSQDLPHGEFVRWIKHLYGAKQGAKQINPYWPKRAFIFH